MEYQLKIIKDNLQQLEYWIDKSENLMIKYYSDKIRQELYKLNKRL